METLCDCGHIAVSDGISTGYGIDKDGKKMCYACCAEYDKETLRETGKLTGYYSGGVFSNWPGSLKITPYYSRTSKHNWGGIRTDYWLKFEGYNYHGVQIGKNSEVSTIRRIKS